MKTKRSFLSGSLLSLFILLAGNAFAGTGGANDGYLMLLAIGLIFLLISGILYFSPLLFQRIKDLWNRLHHC
jgi:hypothetical protein